MVDICALPNRALFRISGSDAREWLQGLVTNDVAKLGSDRALYAALLSPQGKILFDFLVYDQGDSLLVDCEQSSLEPLMKRLSMYRMRSDVALAAEPDLGVLSSCTPLSTDLEFVTVSVPDPRVDKLGWRMIGDLDAMVRHCEAEGHRVDDETVYRDYLHKLGIPDGADDFAEGKAYPLEANFEALHGVSFTKGCFIGQEIVARMKHKTELRKRVLPVVAKEGALPETGDILAGGGKIGDLISGGGAHGLALIRLPDWEKARESDAATEIAGIAIEIKIPEWLPPHQPAS